MYIHIHILPGLVSLEWGVLQHVEMTLDFQPMCDFDIGPLCDIGMKKAFDQHMRIKKLVVCSCFSGFFQL